MKITDIRENNKDKAATPIPEHLYFAMIFEYFLFHPGLKVGPKALLAVLHAKCFRNKQLLSGQSQASVYLAELADKLNVDERTIQNWLKELKKVEAIHVKSLKHLHRANIYTLQLPPYKLKGSSIMNGEETIGEPLEKDAISANEG